MSCSPEMRRFGEDLKAFLATEEAMRLISGFCVTGYGWDTGVCGILADGIAKWLGKDAKVMVLWGRVPEEATPLPVHVAARIDGCYLDADGASTESELLERWGERAQDLKLKRMPGRKPDGILWQPTTARQIARALEARFGPGKVG